MKKNNTPIDGAESICTSRSFPGMVPDMDTLPPGPTQTGWIDDDFAKEVIPIIPMGKLIQPQDIAETILFLASEQAKMITGQVIKISGGHAL